MKSAFMAWLRNAFLLCVAGCATAHAQTPFTTDDAEVTDKGKVHLEVLNEYDLLQRSVAPALRQDSLLTRTALGVAKNVEVGVDVPVLAVFNAAGTIPQRPFGFSDIAVHVKIKFNEEKEDSRIPSFAGAFYVRLPTGNATRSLGSGVRNYQLYGVAQKSLTKKTKLRGNLGIVLAGNTVFGGSRYPHYKRQALLRRGIADKAIHRQASPRCGDHDRPQQQLSTEQRAAPNNPRRQLSAQKETHPRLWPHRGAIPGQSSCRRVARLFLRLLVAASVISRGRQAELIRETKDQGTLEF